VWVDVRNVMPTTAVPAVLRGVTGPMRARDVVERVVKLLPMASRGSVANLFSRLDGKVICKQDEGWVLMDPSQAPILVEGRLWGPASYFQKEELASYRRDVIAYLLSQHQTGLQIVQIVDLLSQVPWVKAPINKDLVKIDMQKLQHEGLARHRGNSRKWELSPEREQQGLLR
jgi:hypothetical protein